MVTHHSLNIKVLYSDDLVLVHQLGRLLMQEIGADVVHLFVDQGYFTPLLLNVLTFGNRFCIYRNSAAFRSGPIPGYV